MGYLKGGHLVCLSPVEEYEEDCCPSEEDWEL